jgi:hypothetical protein
MKKGNPEPLTPKLQAELDALAALPESEIDTAGMPPITDWSNAVRGPINHPLTQPNNSLCEPSRASRKKSAPDFL